MIFGSMNYIEREIAGLHPDIAIVGALADRLDLYQYIARLLRALDYLPVGLPTHWDRFNVPFDMPQTSARNDLDSFISEVKAASPKTRVIIPAYSDPVELPLEHQPAPQQRDLHH